MSEFEPTTQYISTSPFQAPTFVSGVPAAVSTAVGTLVTAVNTLLTTPGTKNAAVLKSELGSLVAALNLAYSP